MTILIDCDGVLLDWEKAFTKYMVSKGYNIYCPSAYAIEDMFGIHSRTAMRLCEEFNESSEIGFLTPIEGSIFGVNQLTGLGYDFICISSVSSSETSQKLRIRNLEHHYGPVFASYHFLPCGASKESALEYYRNRNYFWIEDKIENANMGLLFGLRSILLNRPYNIREQTKPGVIRCSTWEDIIETCK